jgi:hypothetical protein
VTPFVCLLFLFATMIPLTLQRPISGKQSIRHVSRGSYESDESAALGPAGKLRFCRSGVVVDTEA